MMDLKYEACQVKGGVNHKQITCPVYGLMDLLIGEVKSTLLLNYFTDMVIWSCKGVSEHY